MAVPKIVQTPAVTAITFREPATRLHSIFTGNGTQSRQGDVRPHMVGILLGNSGRETNVSWDHP